MRILILLLLSFNVFAVCKTNNTSYYSNNLSMMNLFLNNEREIALDEGKRAGANFGVIHLAEGYTVQPVRKLYTFKEESTMLVNIIDNSGFQQRIYINSKGYDCK